jgi:hypothetical protein
MRPRDAQGGGVSRPLEELIDQERTDQEYWAELGVALVVVWPGQDEFGTLAAPDVSDFLEHGEPAG